MLGLELSQHNLQLPEVCFTVGDGALTATQVLHCLLQDLLGLGASLNLTRERPDIVNIGLEYIIKK